MHLMVIKIKMKYFQDLKNYKFLLKNYEIDALVIACNTATSVAIKHLREVFPL